MDAETQASLLKMLETSDFTGIYKHFADYLHPLTLLNFKQQRENPKRQSKQKPDSSSSIRSLAKTFMPFLNGALRLLPKRLSESPKPSIIEQFSTELFDVYKLCLESLGSISSQLAGKPYSIELQRDRYVHCLEYWNRYEEAVSEGFRVLKALRGIYTEGVCHVNSKDLQFVPCLDRNSDVDAEFARLVVDIVVTIVQCESLNKTKEAGRYQKLLVLLDEVRPWLSILESSLRKKLHRVLLSYMCKATLFLAKEVGTLEGNLFVEFSSATFDEYAALLKDQCSEGKMDKVAIEFLELVSYCAHKCLAASTDVRGAVAKHMYCMDLAPFSLILRLFAIGLYVSDGNVQSNVSCSTTLSSARDESANRLFEWKAKLWELFGSSGNCSCNNLNKNSNSLRCKCTDSIGRICSDVELNSQAPQVWKKENNEVYLSFYLNALKFLCWPLAEFVNSERKMVISEEVGSPLEEHIQQAFDQFCDTFFCCHSCTSEGERDCSQEIDKTVLKVFVAAFTLSLKLYPNKKKGTKFMQQLLSDQCVQSQGLRFLSPYLHNIGVDWFRNRQLKEASKALKFCCRASWTRVFVLCQMFSGQVKGNNAEISEQIIVDLVNEASASSSLLLDILYQLNSHKLDKVIGYSLEQWSAARILFEKLPCPVTLIRQWVKIQCKSYKNPDAEASGRTLDTYLLSSCAAESKQTIGTILEQELSAYEEMGALFPKFCQEMQMKVIGILLQDVYKNSWFQKASVLIKKGRAFRAHGTEGLKASIQCLSEAIEAADSSCGDTHNEASSGSHQLAVAYCLRALCTHEADPNSKQVYDDIHAAISIWLSTNIPDGSSKAQDNMECEHMLLLLYHILDLLSMKGNLSFHSDIYSLIIKLFIRMAVPLEKCLLILWESRRLNHALCVSPISEELMTNISKHYSDDCKSVDFWMSCMKDSRPLLVGFRQNFSFLSIYFPVAFLGKGSSLQSDIMVTEVKEAALPLASSVPVLKRSAFLAGYLYYDMCERLVLTGQLVEALCYAREAHRLRSKLLQYHFQYSFVRQQEKYNVTGEGIKMQSFCVSNFSLYSEVATKVWPGTALLWDSDSCIHTSWNVLQCYLESTLQVGVIHETIGNGAEAEALFQLGKTISCLQGSTIFTVAFSCGLGKLYCKKCLWDLADKELQSAKQVLADSSMSISCLRCQLILDSAINEQLGNLYQSRTYNTIGCSFVELSSAKNLYLSSLKRLNSSEWKKYAKELVEANQERVAADAESNCRSTSGCFTSDLSGTECSLRRFEGPLARNDTNNSRKTKKACKAVQHDTAEGTVRITRSRHQASQSKAAGAVKGVQPHSVDTTYLHGKLPEVMGDCSKIRCFKCFPSELAKSGSVAYVIHLKWEFARRRQMLRLLVGLGKCQGSHGGIHESHETFSRSLNMLVGGDPSCDCCHFGSHPLDLELIGKEIPGDILAIDRATVLYNLCWFSLKAFLYKDTRVPDCDLCCFEMHKIVSLLVLSFVLCREVPLLFQKVSRLLAIVYVVAALRENCSSSLPSCKVLSENHWAAYFHQASVGTHHNLSLLSTMAGKHLSQITSDAQGSQDVATDWILTETCNLLRLAPETTQNIEEFVLKFYESLPSTTIVCLSLLGGAYPMLLQKFLPHRPVHAWMLLSNLNALSEPVVVLIPLDSVLQDLDDKTNFSCSAVGEENMVRQWQCPWGPSVAVIDDLAPMFKSILRGNYASSLPIEDAERNRAIWWMQRNDLDQRLCTLLRDIEEVWFGPWKYLLLGQWLDSKTLNSIMKHLSHHLKVKCEVEVNERLLKVVLGAVKFANWEEQCIPRLFIEKGCYIGRVGDYDQERCLKLYHACDKAAETISKLAFELMLAAVNELDEEHCTNRDQVVLVLDSEVQMLPWENMPILREQEVYRMPSIASISAALHMSVRTREVQRVAAVFPYIDPLDAFYLLNPSGDLSSTQAEFEEWFRAQNLQGKAGIPPTAEELAVALRKHDLYIYFGHGSGAQYIPVEEIQKLENCAATVLMGCSSGCLFLNGSYTPHGVAYSYILAGSPVVVANLWEVTDKDIDRFGKALLKAWMEERSTSSTRCVQCSILAEEFKSMSLNNGKRNSKRVQDKKPNDNISNKISGTCCRHKLKVGYFVSQARKSCKLKFLIGAAPVCYGVPTGIRRKEDL